MSTCDAKDLAIQEVRKFLEQELSGRPSSQSQIVMKMRNFKIPSLDLESAPDLVVVPFRSNYEDRIVRHATSYPEQWEAARRLAIDYLMRGESLPEKLASFVVNLLQDRCPKPRRRNRTYLRNKILTSAVFQLAQVQGISATRNEGTEGKESACDIVARLMQELGYNRIGPVTVKKIWEKHGEYRRVLEFAHSVSPSFL